MMAAASGLRTLAHSYSADAGPFGYACATLERQVSLARRDTEKLNLIRQYLRIVDIRLFFAHNCKWRSGTHMALTRRQKQVYDFSGAFVEEHGYSHSFAEIGEGLGLSSLALAAALTM